MKALRLKLAAGVAVLGAAGVATAAVAHDNSRFDASLTGYEETPTLSTQGHGFFKASIARGKDEIHYVLSYNGPFDANPAGGTVTQAHIHLGRPAIAGGITAWLCGNPSTTVNPPAGTPACPTPGGTVTGTITPPQVIGPAAQGIQPGEFAELVRALRAGAAYANIHTTTFPAGEIRGQISDREDHDH